MKPNPPTQIRTLRQTFWANRYGLLTFTVVCSLLSLPFFLKKIYQRRDPTIVTTRSRKTTKNVEVAQPSNVSIDGMVAAEPTVRFASRLYEASSLLGAVGLCSFSLKAERHDITPNNVITHMIEKKLVPPTLSFTPKESGEVVFYSNDNGWTYQFRIRESPFTVEIIGFGKELAADGNAFVLRAPESFDDPQKGNVALYISPTVKNILPPPFSTETSFVRCGWVRTFFNPENISPSERQRLAIWLAGQNK